MKPTPLPSGGLYAITDCNGGSTPPTAVKQAIAGGARVLQYRDKTSDAGQRRKLASALLALCRDQGVPLIINDDLSLAAEIGADGVHLGRDDGDPVTARKRLGEDAIIGISCYNKLDNARVAVRDGADYIAFGRFFPSASKPDAVQADMALLHKAKRELSVPIVAIGGITAENGGALIDAGADFLAVIRGVFAAGDITAAALQYRALFNRHPPLGR